MVPIRAMHHIYYEKAATQAEHLFFVTSCQALPCNLFILKCWKSPGYIIKYLAGFLQNLTGKDHF